MDNNLVERLRRRRGGWQPHVPGFIDDAGPLINPDGPEAAAQIKALTKEANDHSEAANRWRNQWGDEKAKNDVAAARIKELEEALRPFAALFDALENGEGIWLERPINEGADLSIENFRKARSILGEDGRT
jgi:cytochrome c peroxidase